VITPEQEKAILYAGAEVEVKIAKMKGRLEQVKEMYNKAVEDSNNKHKGLTYKGLIEDIEHELDVARNHLHHLKVLLGLYKNPVYVDNEGNEPLK
jgi:predicted transcriptional regulator